MADNNTKEAVFSKIIVYWQTSDSEDEAVFYDRTLSDAINIAETQFGYIEPRWYKPWTWGNGVVTVNY